MIFRFAFGLLVCILLGSAKAIAQPDTVNNEQKLYSDIQKMADKGKAARFLHRLIFRPVSVAKSQKRKHGRRTELQRPYARVEGRIIRAIHIHTLDPFGTSVQDTSRKAEGFWNDVGNGTHVKTQRSTVRNLLLFQKGDRFDSLLVLESERLVRKQEYVHEVLFYARPVGTDSVDVYIRELDNWSLATRLSGSTSGF